jgi:hypothetical protein
MLRRVFLMAPLPLFLQGSPGDALARDCPRQKGEPVPPAIYDIYQSNEDVEVKNTTAVSTLLSYTINANALDVDHSVSCTLWGTWKNGHADAADHEVALYVGLGGATTLLVFSLIPLPYNPFSGATPFEMTFDIFAKGGPGTALGAQEAFGKVTFNQITTPYIALDQGTATQDGTGELVLTVKAALDSASNNLVITKSKAVVELK